VENRYNQLKEVIKNILLDIPITAYDNFTGDALECIEWESVEQRYLDQYDVSTQTIGSENIIKAQEVLLDEITPDIQEYVKKVQPVTSEELETVASNIFSYIIADLVSERVIRQAPELKRASLKVVNGREEGSPEEIV
jgi:hypothetical protein